MRLQALVLLVVAALLVPNADCAITWVKPVDGDGPCGNVDENSSGNLDPSTSVEATTNVTGQEHYGPVVSVDPSDIGLTLHGQGDFQLASGNIDYETASSMVVVFEVHDNDQFTATGTCTITVNDLNDNSPTFPAGITATVASNTAAGETVTTFAASDADGSSPNNQIVSYAITAGDHGDLVVNAGTGVISVATGKTTNCDTRSSYTLTITAVDGGTPARTGTGTLQVTVTGDGCPNRSTTLAFDAIPSVLMVLAAVVGRWMN